jgi:hypothetical protein
MAGAVLTEVKVPGFDRQAEYFRTAASPGARGLPHSQAQPRDAPPSTDPRVAKRVMMGWEMSAEDT